MRELLTSLDWTRLGFYKSVLDEAGIASFIRNEHTAQLINVLIAPCQPCLCVVNDDDHDAAIALLRPHHDPMLPHIEEWNCASCGENNPAEFELCWNCQKLGEQASC